MFNISVVIYSSISNSYFINAATNDQTAPPSITNARRNGIIKNAGSSTYRPPTVANNAPIRNCPG